MSTVVAEIVKTNSSRKSAASLYVEKCRREAKEAERRQKKWEQEQERKRKEKEEAEKNKPPPTDEEVIKSEQKRQDVDFKQLVKRFGKRPEKITAEDKWLCIYSVIFGGRWEGKAWHQLGDIEYWE